MANSRVFKFVIPFLLVSWQAVVLPSSCMAFSISKSQRTGSCLSTLHQSSSAAATIETTTKETATIAAPDTSSNVKAVFVCTGHLCQGPEDSESADDILNALQKDYGPQLSSTTTVEESVCLGQCGLKAVVAMDYDDGTSKVCFGLEEVLQELGLENNNNKSKENDGAAATVTYATKTEEEEVKPALSSSIVIEDPRDRMRAAAAKQKAENDVNPG